MHTRYFARIFLVFAVVVSVVSAATISLDCRRDLRSQIRSAPSGSRLVGDGRCLWTTRDTIRITRRISLSNFRLKMASGVGRRFAMSIDSDGVRVSDFEMIGNLGTVRSSARQSLLQVSGSNFQITNGRFTDSSRDGITVQPKRGRAINGGTIRNVSGRGNDRDVVALNTERAGAIGTRNIVVDDIEAYSSPSRGAVEVADGVEDITVRNVYAEGCLYAVAIQDHSRSRLESINRVKISDITAVNCGYGILAQTMALRHSDISMENMTFRRCRRAMLVKNLDRVKVSGVRVSQSTSSGTQVDFQSCNGIDLQGISFSDSSARKTAIRISDSTNVRVSRAVLRSSTSYDFGMKIYPARGRASSSPQLQSNDLRAARVPLRIFR